MTCSDGEWKDWHWIDDDIIVLRCSSCKELKAVWRGSATSDLPPNTTDAKIKELLGVE